MVYRTGSQILRVGGGGGILRSASGDPYPLYTSFDRNTVPWHTGSGSWGPQYPIVAPTPPTPTRSVTVTTVGQFNTEAAVAATRITIGASFSETSQAVITANDVDVILPTGLNIGSVEVGAFPWDYNVARTRIRGSLDGSRGGRMGQFRTPEVADRYSDIIIDGVDMNASSGFGAGENNQGFRGNVNRMFVHNVRGISPAYMSQLGAYNIVIANCTLFSGAITRSEAGYPEGWNWRTASGPIYFIDSDMQTTRYHVLRPQTYNNLGEYLYVKNCRIINLAEGQMIWAGNRVSEPSFGYWYASIIEDSFLYSGADSGCGFGDSQVISLNTCTYSRIRRNTIYSNGTGNRENRTLANLTADRDLAISLANADSTLVGTGRAPLPSDAHSSDSDLATNTFATLTGHPGWRGPGDPRSVPLPSGYTLSQGESTCPAIWT